MHMLKTLTIAAPIFVCLACGGNYTVGHLHSDLVLPDGTKLKVLTFDKSYSEGKPYNVGLEYDCQLVIDDSEALRNQVRAVWLIFKPEVDSLGFNRATIIPKKITKVLGAEYTKQWCYVLERQSNGKWTLYNGFDYLPLSPPNQSLPP